MYEHFKNELLARLSEYFSSNDLKNFSKIIDIVATNYDIKTKCTDICVYEEDIPHLLKTYIVCKKIEGLSEKTLYNYLIILKNFFNNVKKSPENITANEIRIYLYTYQDLKKITNRSLDKIRQIIAGFYQWAQDEEYISKNPAKSINKIKYEVKPRKSLTQIELEYIRRSCFSMKEKAIVEFLYSTGCRVSELSNVKISDVDFIEKKVHLIGKGNKHRESYINAKAEVALKEYIEIRKGESEYLFVSDRSPFKQLSKAGIEKIIRNISTRVYGNKNTITPHVFRHTTATEAMRNGMPVESIQLMLGHSKIETTMIYAHADANIVQEQHRKAVI